MSAGDRIALYLEGTHLTRWLIAYVAIHKAAAVAVPVNTRLSAAELRTILIHAAPTLAVTSSALGANLAGVGDDLTSLRWTIHADTGEWDEALAHDALPVDCGATDDDLAEIMYTSGTTGLPKGIAVRHRDTHIIANNEPTWTGQSWLHSAPLFTFAGIAFVYNPMKMGMSGLYLARFDVDHWFDAVEQHRPSCAFLVPSMAQLLVGSSRFATADLSSLTLVSIGSAPLQPALHQTMAERLSPALVTNNYSMTEAGTTFTHLPPEEIGRRAGSVGVPVGGEIRIVDDDGNTLAPGELGEILVRVGNRHREYYRDPEATAATWGDGWLHSGDLGTLDADGYLYIRGRKKDMIIRGGNNVMAADVEAVLVEHPGVFEAAVVPVTHQVLGEDVGAAVVARPGVDIDLDELRAFSAARLADYKVPRRIWLLDALPRNPTGKVVKPRDRRARAGGRRTMTDRLHTFTLADIAREHARSYPGRVAMVDGAVRHTWPEHDERIARLANALSTAGVGRGDVVLWTGQNSHRILECLGACARLGAVLCIVNWRQSADELAFVLDDADAKVVIWQQDEVGEVVRTARAAAGNGRAVWLRHDGDATDPDGYEAFLATGSNDDADTDTDPGDPVLMLYTAAFLGTPNGAMLSHHAVLVQSLMMANLQRIDDGYSYLNSGPMFHVATLMTTLATYLMGGRSVFVPRPTRPNCAGSSRPSGAPACSSWVRRSTRSSSTTPTIPMTCRAFGRSGANPNGTR